MIYRHSVLLENAISQRQAMIKQKQQNKRVYNNFKFVLGDLSKSKNSDRSAFLIIIISVGKSVEFPLYSCYVSISVCLIILTLEILGSGNDQEIWRGKR